MPFQELRGDPRDIGGLGVRQSQRDANHLLLVRFHLDRANGGRDDLHRGTACFRRCGGPTVSGPRLPATGHADVAAAVIDRSLLDIRIPACVDNRLGRGSRVTGVGRFRGRRGNRSRLRAPEGGEVGQAARDDVDRDVLHRCLPRHGSRRHMGRAARRKGTPKEPRSRTKR